METSNLLSILNRLVSLNKAVSEAIQTTQLNIEIAKMICERLDEIEKVKSNQVIPDTRKLALEQIKFLN